jgi:hypothetical protein
METEIPGSAKRQYDRARRLGRADTGARKCRPSAEKLAAWLWVAFAMLLDKEILENETSLLRF